MSLLISMSSRAEFVSVVDLVKAKDCQIELLRPVVIMKKEMTANANLLEFRTNFMDRKGNQRFAKGTMIKVKRATRVAVYFEDIFLNRLCVLEGNLCADLDRMSKLDLEYSSNNSIKVHCKKKR